MNRRSLVVQLGALHALMLSATFVMVGAASYYGLQHYLRTSLLDSIRRRSEQVEQIIRAAPVAATSGSLAQEIENRLAPEFNSRFVRVTQADGTVLYQSGLPADRSFDPSRVPRPVGMSTEPVGGQHLMMNATVVYTSAGHFLVEMGASTLHMDEVLDRLFDLLLLLLPVLLISAAAGGYLLVSRALRSVDRISQAAQRISLENLDLRLPVVRSGDALERLSCSLNGMLGRLTESVRSSGRFVADASHELRTPLTVIKGELQEIIREQTWDEAQLHDRIGSVLEEVARLEHLVSGLLAISRLDAGEMQREWQDVDLAQLAASTAEQMRLLAEERGVHIDPSRLQSARIRGDPARLKQVVVNLLDNAIRFTPRGGSVQLRTESDNGGGMLEVSDTGIGIPPAAVAQVFDRFYRVDQARSRDDGGAGLGLSIVKSICSLHGAAVEVRSGLGRGSSFRVSFPRRAAHADTRIRDMLHPLPGNA